MKEKITALIEFCYVKELEFEADVDNDDIDKIVKSMLNKDSNPLNEDYNRADYINVSYKYADGTESDWCEL